MLHKEILVASKLYYHNYIEDSQIVLFDIKTKQLKDIINIKGRKQLSKMTFISGNTILCQDRIGTVNIIFDITTKTIISELCIPSNILAFYPLSCITKSGLLALIINEKHLLLFTIGDIDYSKITFTVSRISQM